MSSSVNSAPNQSSVFYLEKPKPSIFHGVECREYPNFKNLWIFRKRNGNQIMKRKTSYECTRVTFLLGRFESKPIKYRSKLSPWNP